MFSSLDKIDMMGEQDGVKICVQSDHRSPEEMDETPELSVLFALVRMLVPRQVAQDGEPAPRIRYTGLQGASRGVHEAIAAAGGELESMANGSPESVPFVGTPRSVRDIADEAFRGLAHRVALREDLRVDANGLKALEESVLEAGWDFEDDEDEIPAWTALMELAAFAGECLRQLQGGRWVLTEEVLRGGDGDHGITADDFGLLPFSFARDNGQFANVANKARRVMGEPGQSMLQMLVVDDASAADDGPTVVVLKPPEWGSHAVISRPLLQQIPDVPLAVIATDMPNTVAYTTTDGETDEEVDAAFEQAYAHLRSVEVQVEKLDLDAPIDLYVVHGDFYAAEKILDVSFMHTLHAQLGQELLAVSVPVKGRMFVTAGIQSPENLGRMMALTQGVFEGEPHPISPLVFGVMDGQVNAVIQAQRDDEPPKKKGLWRRLFGK
ncbi:MAG: hypothetical protein AAF721_02515 [Myxococcota bacterium]